MRRFAVVTTCNASGYREYGQTMVESFLRHWPAGVALLLYHEGFEPPSSPGRIESRDLAAASPGLRAFKARHAGRLGANGSIRPLRLGRLRLPIPVIDRRDRFRWDAVRFSHKAYAIFDAARRADVDVLIWIDADTLFFADVAIADLEGLSPRDSSVSCLRRPDHSECGFVAYNLRNAHTRRLLEEFEAMYDRDLLFGEREYHDSYLFDVVRARAEARGARTHDIAEGRGTRSSHVLVNSSLGRFMDHLKGDRKSAGASLAADLLAPRPEPYWQRASAGDRGP
jgi:hypothetical protein